MGNPYGGYYTAIKYFIEILSRKKNVHDVLLSVKQIPRQSSAILYFRIADMCMYMHNLKRYTSNVNN